MEKLKKTYKIAAISYNGGPFLDLWQKNYEKIPVNVPAEYKEDLRCGMNIRIHTNREDEAIAYSVANRIIFTKKLPLSRGDAQDFVHGLRDIYELSLDSLYFRYALRQALKKSEMGAIRDMVTGLRVYAFHVKQWRCK